MSFHDVVQSIWSRHGCFGVANSLSRVCGIRPSSKCHESAHIRSHNSSALFGLIDWMDKHEKLHNKTIQFYLIREWGWKTGKIVVAAHRQDLIDFSFFTSLSRLSTRRQWNYCSFHHFVMFDFLGVYFFFFRWEKSFLCRFTDMHQTSHPIMFFW